MATAKRKTTPTSKKPVTFSLKLSSSISEIHDKYGINLSTTNTTSIVDDDVDVTTLSYHDEFRKLHRCCISRINFSNSKVYSCFWDRCKFATMPVGCPVAFKPMTVVRKYNSEISKDSFTVKESISRNQKISDDIELSKLQSESYYETDGIFCSVNCCLSFAIENRHNPLYEKSIPLLHKMFGDITGSTSDIQPAPSWRLLEEYGGHLTIEKFRSNLTHINYEFKNIHRSCFNPLGFVFEEKIKL